MYIPKHFEVADRAPLYALMDRFNFATLVTVHEDWPIASHLPFLIYPEVGEQGLLIGHMARANTQWRDFEDNVEALVIFQGHHAYISPSWYATTMNVPTWNYMVVHAYGVPHIVSDEQRVRTILRDLVAKQEAGNDSPWEMNLPEEYERKMMRGIVAFEIPITRLEGKFKLSQNQPPENRERVIEALAHGSEPVERELSALMQGLK